MKQILKKSTKTFAFLIVFMTLTNCVNESPGLSNQDASVANAKKWFDLNQPDLAVLGYTQTIDWSNAIVSDGDNGLIVEVPLILKGNITAKIGRDKSYQTYNRLMFVTDKQETYKAYNVLITTNDIAFDNNSKNCNFYKLNTNFNGYITVINVKKEITDFNTLLSKDVFATTKTGKLENVPTAICINLVENFDDGSSTFIASLGCFGGGGGIPSTGYAGTPGKGTADPVLPLTKAEQIENKIISTNLDPCPKAVLDALKNASNIDIATILTKLGANDLYSLSISSGIPIGNSNSAASTTKISDYNYNMIISQNYTSCTKLYRASIILHEVVHAYFLSIVDDYNANNNAPRNYDLNSFPSLFQAFCDKNYPPSSITAANAHHLEMAQKYVDDIALSLQEFNSGTSTYQVYSDLAWATLNGTPIFDQMFPLGSTDRIRILDRLACESSGRAVSEGTSNQQNPVGKPCN